MHAFILDTLVTAGARRQGDGAAPVASAKDPAGSDGCQWLQVDCEVLLRDFCFDACGGTSTSARLIAL